MTLTLETDVGYLFEVNKQHRNGIPDCFLQAAAAGRIGRGRERDWLLLHMHFQEGTSESSGLKELLTLAHRHYYDTSGSVTAAARAAINAANMSMLESNRAGGAPPLQAGLTCAVMRGTELYVTQAGPGKTLVLRQESSEQFPDRKCSLRPLGVADKSEIYYYHTILAEGDLLWMGRLGPIDGALSSLRLSGNGDWHGSLAVLREMTNGNGPALLCRFCSPGEQGQLVAALAAGTQVAAVVENTDEVKRELEPELTPNSPASDSKAMVDGAGGPSAVQGPERQLAPALENSAAVTWAPSIEAVPHSEPARLAAASTEPEKIATMHIVPESVTETVKTPLSEIEGLSADVLKPMMISAAPRVDPKKRVRVRKQEKTTRTPKSVSITPSLEPAVASMKKWYLRLPLAAFHHRVESGSASLQRSFNVATQKLLARVLPGTESEVQLSASALLWFAAGVPVLVVVLTLAAYIQFGRAREFNYYLDEARTAATVARAAPDAAQGIPYWRQVLVWTGEAADVRRNHPEVAALQQSAQAVVDGVDRVERVRVEAITADGFRTDANLVKILARGSSLYALDETNQAVYRAVLTTSGEYQLDPVFECRRGPVGMQSIEALVDFTWLSRPNVVGQDTLLALDPGGQLLYCTTDGAMAATVLTPPYDGWTGPVAIEAFQNRIYVLEPDVNEIWVYEREDKIFPNPPERYFSESMVDLSTSIDISIVQGTVFILHRDGHMTQCVRREHGAAPECSIEMRYSDGRPGRFDETRFEGLAAPTAMVAYAPPHSSLYLSDSNSAGAYQFSLRLAYQREFRAFDENGEVAATSFAVGSGRDLFFASGNNVYVGRRR